jgi:hypothetical protein
MWCVPCIKLFVSLHLVLCVEAFSICLTISSKNTYLPTVFQGTCRIITSHPTSRLSSVFSSLSLATNLAGSEYITQGSDHHKGMRCDATIIHRKQKFRINQKNDYHLSQQWREYGDTLALSPAIWTNMIPQVNILSVIWACHARRTRVNAYH